MDAQKEPEVASSSELTPKKKKTKPEPVPFQIITRSAKARLNAFAFELLPTEVKENVFKFLRLLDLKSVRFVSREWEIISFRHIGIRKAPLNDATIPTLKNCRYLIRELFLTCLKDGRALRGFVGIHVQRLELKYPRISSRALTCLFKACQNLEQLHIVHFQRRAIRRSKSNLLMKILQKAMPACSNLKQLKLNIYPKNWKFIRKWGEVYFDCSCLLECKKLDVINIVTVAPVYFRNVGPLAKALELKNFSFLYLGEISTLAIAPSVEADIFNQLMNSGLQSEDDNDLLPTQEQLNQLREILAVQGHRVNLDYNPAPAPSKTFALMLEYLRQVAQAKMFAKFKKHIISTSFFAFAAAGEQGHD